MLKKLLNNLGPSALSVLGGRHYLLLLFGFLRQTKTILRTKKLTSLDLWMSRPLTVRVFGQKFRLDCRAIDAMIPEDSYTFGLVREIYISKCYLRFDGLSFPLKNVIDLGGNRGIFSLLAASFSELVIYVEAQQHYQQAVNHSIKLNALDNIRLVHAYIGAEAALPQGETPAKTVESILQEFNLDVVDFLKIDIEGSEFALFESMESLSRIRYIAAEIHPHYGDPQRILSRLQQFGFSVHMRNENLEPIQAPLTDQFFYIYAFNPKAGNR